MPEKIATFDLDGTILRKKIKGASTLKMDAINSSIEKVFSVNDINYADHIGTEMFGMTDKSIVREVLRKINIDKRTINNGIDTLFGEIVDYFNNHQNGNPHDDYIILPGIVKLLDVLKNNDVKLGVATGNIPEFAWWKLKAIKLDHYFTFGGFGDDSENRSDIIACALRRAGYKNGCNACHFGDTPADIKAAKDNRIKSVVISSNGGGTFDADLLKNAGADLVVESWEEVDNILEFFG